MLQDLHMLAFMEGDWSANVNLSRFCSPVAGVLKAVTSQADTISSSAVGITILKNNVPTGLTFSIPRVTGANDSCFVHEIPALSRIALSEGDLITLLGDGAPAADAGVYFGFVVDAVPPWNVASIYVDGPVVGTIGAGVVAAAWKRGWLDRIAWCLRATHAGGTAAISIFKNAVDTGLAFDVINATVDVAGSYGVETFAKNALFIEEGDVITLVSDGGGAADGAIDSQVLVRT